MTTKTKRHTIIVDEFIEYMAPLIAKYYKPGQPAITYKEVASWSAVDANSNGLSDVTGFEHHKDDKGRIAHATKTTKRVIKNVPEMMEAVTDITGILQPIPWAGVVVVVTPEQAEAALDLSKAQSDGKARKRAQYRLAAAKQFNLPQGGVNTRSREATSAEVREKAAMEIEAMLVTALVRKGHSEKAAIAIAQKAKENPNV